MIRMMCVIRLVDWVLTDVFCDRVGVAVKTEDLNSKLFVVVWSYVEISIPKSVRLWKLKKLRKEESTNDIAGRMHKEEFRVTWLKKRGCI